MHQRKIPTVIGLLLVGFAVLVFRFAFDQASPFLTRASSSATPLGITMSNISDTSFTVSWMTTAPATGSIRLNASRETIYDDRLSTTSDPKTLMSTSYTTYMVTVRNVQPDTEYAFEIISNGRSYKNSGRPYVLRTAPQVPGLGTGMEPAFGKITSPSGLPVENALVYLTLDGGQTLVTLTKSGGTWVIPLNRVRTTDLSAYISPSERIDETITVRTSDGESFATSDTLNDNPVPDMVIGKSYDFRKIQAERGVRPEVASVPPTVLGATAEIHNTVSITKPGNGATIPSNLPLIQGTGIPGMQILIVIGIVKPVSDTLIVPEDGVWRYTPPKPLDPGKQSVTITTTDAKNKSVAITHLFEVLKSGTQVLGEATPSGTIAPLPTTGEEPTPTATLAGEPIPETGSSLPLILMLILGIGLVSSGLMLTYARRYS